MVKLKYRKYGFVSNGGEYNMLWCGTEMDFADIPYESQISADVMYIEKCSNINFSESFSDTKRISNLRLAFRKLRNIWLYIASANRTNYGLSIAVT